VHVLGLRDLERYVPGPQQQDSLEREATHEKEIWFAKGKTKLGRVCFLEVLGCG
jgi:hypothetical protein